MTSGTKTVEEAVMEVLRKAKMPMTTYQIAKKVGASWGSVNTACYKLKDAGLVEKDVITPRVGSGKKVVWWAKKKS